MPRARIPDVLRPESTLVAFDKPDAWLRGFNRSQVVHLEVFGGDEDEEDDLLQQWGRDISLWDEEGWSNSGGWLNPYQCVGDVHIYLVAKLFRTLANMKNLDWYANKIMEAGPTRCMACFAYTDGTSDRRLRQWGKYRPWLMDATTHCAASAPYDPTKEKADPG